MLFKASIVFEQEVIVAVISIKKNIYTPLMHTNTLVLEEGSSDILERE